MSTNFAGDLHAARQRAREYLHADENQCVGELLAAPRPGDALRQKILRTARELVRHSRQHRSKRGTLDAFLQQFGLSNKEGVALMCLAESLLRVPDADTADKLIAEKVHSGNWASHRGQSDSLFVNASTWGLMLTGSIVELDPDITEKPASWVKRLVSRLGEPMVRASMMQAMKIMGGQYVLGRTIEEALKRGPAENLPGTRFSFDMLGEGARTMADAERYFDAYMSAIETIGKNNDKRDVVEANGISIKLSALHPRYSALQRERVMNELLPQVKALCAAAARYDMGLNIDAEEADRLDISLDIFEALARDPELKGWQGLGFVMQAYQKRAPHVADWLIALGRDTGRKLMVRLVKGAYWDSEIKHAQQMGLTDYPVYTRKCHTDLSYQVCAKKLLEARDAIYPQFATHNAYTVGLILELAGDRDDYEFQRLHGMGHLLYAQVEAVHGKRVPVRVYAPVGAHRDLLPYLVRRLLENGANSSFVNRFMDEKTPVEELVQDTIELSEACNPYRHPQIPVPEDIYMGAEALPRKNSHGLELTDPIATKPLLEAVEAIRGKQFKGGPIVDGVMGEADLSVHNPATGDLVGYTANTDKHLIDRAYTAAVEAQTAWDRLGGNERAKILDRIAELYEKHIHDLTALICMEAGRTLNDGISEVREAVDFCRYYANGARQHFSEPQPLPGPTGESNQLYLCGRGVFVAISPWNFPLAIFTGQVVAALASGNAVLAKPAEQTPLIAARAVQLMHEAGVPEKVLHLITGTGATVGKPLIEDPRLSGVAFTGSTETARLINQQLAMKEGPITPLIAETGGQNVMIVDSTALPEQVVDDVIQSAFLSAGQRCSALRILCVQDVIADNLLEMLKGACKELTLGDPSKLETDIGPVIDEKALSMLERHRARMQKEAKPLFTFDDSKKPAKGTFFGPQVVEIEDFSLLEREVFGPFLHVVRFKAEELEDVIRRINATGYGLTFGLHSRIEGRAHAVFKRVKVGNCYVNRDMVGAVVGVNPFGGQGLSGTGPKAGGPHYLFRFGNEKTKTINTVATGGNTQLFTLGQ
ncbi:bifunctional proline dehydrogenase/L-glutamate gamma-semialdehyde dehydrogenase PutA [Microbulbifer thermotolerans]|uniref:bifunctional proline dehydrogenase/L-glutamate gamma-semialdehyde dehydrogenase PutA n=1 Tax=Microbulbifer thermotolerans TaxID=252514 RepID=UPI00224B5FCA|nr:bifunctional proline dehydrogenase/L-glutamate gamma-semialdehyde dehydrogenase PutA [Microbulbifer thermotolerans]MCX2779949.1 bifunctional proline dehydrogenase/L-glutamate gamma-semialdehyde dehydrogenase PutA [Microbulbifer thermotolerans]MCX2805372.1 bifunctional proline dehydrogenase/L-glutamate gamma-semialdehyde dehydrogenase PutA [Microbulbifer thermotolerans]MCX2842848.1 bifunctional proline dehydrogenase/L-glutamate gamma-semialdehyde dehydrogenase PutA [Microbulbifer thermotoleran